MNISFTHRLSFKQATLTVLVAFILGTLLSIIQVTIDYANEDASIDREIQALLEISRNPASRIIYNIDSELAQELVLGLLRSPAVTQAALIDNSGLILASVSRPRRENPYRVISDSLFGAKRIFVEELSVAYAPDEALGRLRLEVDTYAFGSDFLDRSLLTFAAGFTRSLLLALILLVLFYFMLTKPLVGIIRNLSRRKGHTLQSLPVPCPPGHERDEIGRLVEVTNEQLAHISQEMEQRRRAEDQLTQYSAQLESIVSTRTAELKASNERLSQSNQELEQARTRALNMAHSRSVFLASMSHEIRTPLNGLLGMLELAQDGPLTADQRQQLSIAHDSGKVLIELLNDILDLSKFEAGQAELEHITFDLSVLVEETATLFSQNATADVELTCLIDPKLPSQMLGDPTRVRQILSNLLSNALKFTRKGQVSVIVEPTHSGIRLRVRDTGIGISAEGLQRIFQPYTQAQAGITREFGGTGLGLTLTRRLCEAMQGTLTVKSEEGSGSEFCAELPLFSRQHTYQWPQLNARVVGITRHNSGLDQMLGQWLPIWGLSYQRLEPNQLVSDTDIVISDDAKQLEQAKAHSIPSILVTAYGNFLTPEEAEALAPLQQLARPLSRADLLKALKQCLNHDLIPRQLPITGNEAVSQHARVLLVEDNQVNQMVAKGMLKKLGYHVLVAENGQDALERLQHETVDLVLMDCNMPIMDGYETSRRIRSDQHLSQLPIIALTANALSDERERCRAAGMNDYLAKPFRKDELSALLEKWLQY